MRQKRAKLSSGSSGGELVELFERVLCVGFAGALAVIRPQLLHGRYVPRPSSLPEQQQHLILIRNLAYLHFARLQYGRMDRLGPVAPVRLGEFVDAPL